MAKTNKATPQSTPSYTKESLFNDFYRSTKETLNCFELHFGISNLNEQVLGIDPESEETRLRQLHSWKSLSNLYDYAVDGLEQTEDPMDTVLGGAEALSLVTIEMNQPSSAWDSIVRMADGRYALEEGMGMDPHNVALLAKVDIRTVRNAISGGEMIAEKSGDTVLIENASARQWLLNRKGFVRTIHQSATSLSEVDSPSKFGSALIAQRERQNIQLDANVVAVFHSSVSKSRLKELEGGIFTLPLDAVFPLADFYQFSRKEFLACVMRVFFPQQLEMLEDTKS